jgi:hypothetical protein
VPVPPPELLPDPLLEPDPLPDPEPLLDELEPPLLDPLPEELPDELPDELPELEPLLDAPGHVVPPGSQPVPQLTVWQWYPCASSLLVQPHDSPRCPAHALASLPMKTHAFASQLPPPPLLLPAPLLPLLLLPPLLPPPLLPLPLPPPLLLLLLAPPAHWTGDQSAGTASGVHPGSLVCACTHAYVEPP